MNATPAHQRSIALHEVGHVMAGHSGGRVEPGHLPAEEPSEELLAQLLPGLPSWMIQTELHREAYDTDQEREAELVTSLIWSGPGGTR